MKEYMVEYTTDNGATREIMLVSAVDYTKAYLKACYALPSEAIIITVDEA